MSDSTNTCTGAASTTGSRSASDFDLTKKLIGIYGITGAIVLGTLTVLALVGEELTAFMWVRAAILLAVTPLLSRFAARAEQGRGSALQRLRFLATVLPVAIIAVDLVPGVCPRWYAVLQGVSALALVPIAFLTRRPEIGVASPTQS